MLVQLIPFANEDQKYFQKQKTKKNSQKQILHIINVIPTNQVRKIYIFKFP